MPDDHPDFAYSPLLRAERLTLSHMIENHLTRLTKVKTYKRNLVRRAAERLLIFQAGQSEFMTLPNQCATAKGNP